MDYTARLKEIGSEDPETMEVLIDIFLEQVPELLATIQSAQNNKDPQDLRESSHALKGVCLNLGIDDMADIALSIEQTALSANYDEISPLIQNLESTFQTVSEQFLQLKNQ